MPDIEKIIHNFVIITENIFITDMFLYQRANMILHPYLMKSPVIRIFLVFFSFFFYSSLLQKSKMFDM